VADPRTPTHTTSDDVSCADCGDLEEPMCNRCFGEFATAAIKRLTFERDEARAAVDAARADGEHAATTRILTWLRGLETEEADWFADMIEGAEIG
jgi:hypothetical protein